MWKSISKILRGVGVFITLLLIGGILFGLKVLMFSIWLTLFKVKLAAEIVLFILIAAFIAWVAIMGDHT